MTKIFLITFLILLSVNAVHGQKASTNLSEGEIIYHVFQRSFYDSNGDGKPYNDQDHFEQFQVRDGDTNEKTTGDNALVYLPDAAQPGNRILLRSGVRKLPNREIFAITNSTTVLINLGLADSYGRDWNQSVDIQLIAIPRNRTAVTNTISILP